MSLTKVTNSMIAGAVINILDYGASTSANSTVNTAAIQAAIDYATSLGGGTVYVPQGSYLISQLEFKSAAQVIIEGQGQTYTYGNSPSTSVLLCTTGVWAIRFNIESSCCGIRNLGIASNGLVETSAPFIPSVLGVEYGILIENGVTLLENVNVYGFQYGCVIANYGNSNIFDKCSFSWNTKVGFACTLGSAPTYALYHPNLTPPNDLGPTTVYTMRNCNIRRNAWGMVLRDGSPTMYNVLCESNIFGGQLYWVGSLDNSTGSVCNSCYAENNWLSFTPTLVAWATSSLVGNNLLKNNTGTYIALSDDVSNALSDFGYQITIGCVSPGTTQGPTCKFNYLSASLSYDQKGLFIKQGFLNTFNNCSFTGGDIPNVIRLGDASGGYLANATHFYNLNATAPSGYSNRGALVMAERSASTGGLTAIEGSFRGLSGKVTEFATEVPTTVTSTPHSLTLAQNSVIVNYAGTCDVVFLDASTSANVGRWIHIKTITANAVINTLGNIVPITGGAAGTAILSATAGEWASLQSDGTNWVIMAQG